MEYVVILGVAVIFLLVMVLYFSGQLADFNEKKLQIQADELAYSLKIELDTAQSVQKGYFKEVKLPSTLEGEDYNVLIHGKELVLYVKDYEKTVFISEVKGNFSIGTNIVKKLSTGVVIS